METAAGVAATRGGSLRIPSPSSSRKEWRAVTEPHTGRNAGETVDLEQSKLDQSDERMIYEHGREPVDVDFCSITVDRNSDNDILQQQRLHTVARQREELQQLEIELRAQMIARSEMMEMQNSFDAQIKEHASAAAKLQEQLHEKDRTIRELERKMEEKDRELHAIKLDNEAAWAKEGLLREQNKELATFRRERDHSEAERAQHIKQIHDLQEHIQDKERQLIDLQEQNRIAQETILYKDEQLREAQAWITRAQEMDALQSTTNHSLQTELRERTEQYNQLWLGCQGQFAEMERLHLHTVQQLQLQLANAREMNGSCADDSCISRTNSNSTSQFVQNSGNQLDASGSREASANTGIHSNGNSENIQSFTSTDKTAAQSNHVPGVPIAPSSLLGMPAYLPPGQMTPLHSFVMHQQGVPQSHVGHMQSALPVSSIQQWQQQEAVPEASQNHMQPSQGDHGSAKPDAKYEYQISVNGQALRPDYMESTVSPSSGKPQALESIDGNYLVSNQSEGNLQHISSKFHDALRLDSHVQNLKPEEVDNSQNVNNSEGKVLPAKQNGSGSAASPSNTIVSNGTGPILPEALMLSGTVGRTSESALLDERSLLACIVRTIPAGGRIRISSTLPNRLGKMLAPLHWHDYRKKHGKLDDFVGSHPELFVIEGDYIQLREGAQKMVAASAAAAKVAAAASASSPHSMFLAVTPMAQTHGLKKTEKTILKENAATENSQLSGPNGVFSGVGEAFSNVKILTKSRDPQGRPNSDFIGKQQARGTTGASMASRR